MKVILILLVALIVAVVAFLRPKILILTLAACSSCASAALRSGLSIGGVAMNIRRWDY